MDSDKSKVLLYVHDEADCVRLRKIFNRTYDLEVTYTRDMFVRIAAKENIDAGILCFCYADEKDISNLIEFRERVVQIPLIVSSKIPNPDFIQKGVHSGIEHFLLCEMSAGKIKSKIRNAIENHGLRTFIQQLVIPGTQSQYTSKIIKAILYALPDQLSIAELANQLGVSPRWVQSLFNKIFGRSYTNIMRTIRVYQSLNLMKSTSLDNTEIALELNYSDENSLYKIFVKELGISPSEARNYLSDNDPEQLFK